MEYVSVVLPTYNREKTIKRAVESVLRQTYQNFELLVVDDGSVDDTQNILSEIHDKRMHYIRLPENRGVAAARNVGVCQARYDYVAFEDSDDVWHDDKLEREMKVFMNRPEVGIVYSAYRCIWPDGGHSVVPDDFLEKKTLCGDVFEELLQGNMIGMPTAVIRRSCFEKCGLFNETLTCLEDWELFLRIAKEYKVGYVQQPLVTVYATPGGVSYNKGGFYYTQCYLIGKYKNELLKRGLFDSVIERLLQQAERDLAVDQVVKMLETFLKDGSA